jgi:serpin B
MHLSPLDGAFRWGRSQEDVMDGPHRRAFLASFGALAALGMLPRGAVAQQRAGVAALAAAYNATGQKLFGAFATAPGNIVFSPYSIGTALAMALAGARAETEREMAMALNHRLARMEIADANAGALAILNGYGKSAEPARCLGDMRLNGDRCESAPTASGSCPPTARREGERCVAPAILPPSARLLVANALMTGAEAPVSKDYVALLQEKYSAEVFTNAGLAEVNGWVKRKTEEKIDKILDQLSPDAIAVILNAAYFKAAWAMAFAKHATRSEAFNLSPGQQVEVPMMHNVAAYAVAARAGYRAIRLPYSIRAIGMVVVVPDAVDGLAAMSARLGAQELPELFGALRTASAKSIDLALPRFKSEFRANLVPPLQQAGMRLAFDIRRADFSGITGRPAGELGLAIDQIVHRAMIDVHEEGTEAAAATAISIVRTSAALSPEPFRVDRPFLYYIVDETTGAILFQGRVVDPR